MGTDSADSDLPAVFGTREILVAGAKVSDGGVKPHRGAAWQTKRGQQQSER